jgi:hypothetical protein
MAINKISDEQLHKIIKKSAKSLPNRPTRAGYTAEEIKKHLTDFVLGDEDSIKVELDRIVDEINKEIENDSIAIKFSQKLYEDSINLFNSRDVNQGSSVESINNRVHIIFLNKVKAGETFTISRYNENIRYSIGYKESPNQNADIIHESGWKTDSTYSLTAREDSYLCVNFSYADNSVISPSDIKATDFQIEKGSVATPYKPYNAKMHITNSEAEFLKEKYDNSINLIDLIDVPTTTFNGVTYKIENGAITINGTAEDNFVLKFNLKNNLKLDGTYSSGLFESGTKNNAWGIVLEFDDLERSADFGFVGVTYNKHSDHLYMGFDTGFTYSNYVIKPMLVEGNIELKEYHNYNQKEHINNEEAKFLKDEHDKSLNIARPTQPTINHFTQLSIIESGYRAKATSSATEGGGAYYYSIIVFDDVQTGTYTLSAKALSSNQNSIPAIKPFDYVNGNIGTNQLAEIVWEKGGGENRKHVTFDFDASNGNKLALVIYSNANGTVNTNDYIDYTDLMLNDGGLLQYQPYNSSSHITNGQADLLKSEYKKQSNKLSIELLASRSSGVDYWVNEKGNLVLNGTCTGADLHAPIKPVSLNGTYYFKCFNSGYNKKIGLVDGWNLIGSTDEGIIYYNGTIDKIWFYDLAVGYTFDNYEIELMLVDGASEPTEFVSWYGQIIHEKDMTPLKVWENAQPNAEFISQTATFSESVLDASLIRIDMRRNNSSYAGTLSFFVKADALGGSIPLSASFVEGGTEYRPSRTCAFYNHAGLYFDNGYLGTAQNNAQMIPVAIYKYKY